MHNFDISRLIKLVSLRVALILLTRLILIAIVFLIFISSYEASESEHYLIGELLSGVKMLMTKKMYVSILSV